MVNQDSGALIKQIAQLFRDKEDVDAQLEKEKKARLRADQVRSHCPIFLVLILFKKSVRVVKMCLLILE